nr:hypothetical protein [Tanacetum cinerariifolium]
KNSIQASLSNQTNEVKNMMASLFQMNTTSTLGRDLSLATPLLTRRVNSKAITTQSGLVLDGPTIPTPHLLINPEEDEHVEETLTDLDLSEYTIKNSSWRTGGRPGSSSRKTSGNSLTTGYEV